MSGDGPIDDLAGIVRDTIAHVRYAESIGDRYLGVADRPSSGQSTPDGTTGESNMHQRPAAPRTVAPSTDAPDPAGARESLAGIRSDLGDCTRCKLHEQRRTIVYGEGNPAAALMFVGEGPGADEDASGRPFVGAAGQLLDRIIEAIGLRRDDVYIANVVKCRPPGNRKPERDEAATCEPFLHRQIAAIAPKIIVALGNTPVESLLGFKGGITKLRGQFFAFRDIPVMPTFHPAYLLRDPSRKRDVWEDMKKVKARLDEA